MSTKQSSEKPTPPSEPKNERTQNENNSEFPTNVATEQENAKLEHTNGGQTTRSDKTDLGVAMLPGSPKERVEPEDALGAGLKRGDYSGRLGDANYRPHESNRIEGAKPGEAQVEAVAQAPRTLEIGDEPGKKGGVETDPNFNGR